MADDDDSAAAPPAAGHPNRTMQIDALTDVQLVDNADDAAEPDAEEAAPVPGRAPPPLPPSKKRSPAAMVGGFALVVVVTGGLGALGAHFLVPPAAAPAPVAVASPPPPAAEPEPEMRHVRLDDEFVIGGPAPDAGAPATAE